MSPRAMPELFAALVSRVEVGQEHLSITFRSVELRRFLLWKGSAVFRGRQADWTCSDAATSSSLRYAPFRQSDGRFLILLLGIRRLSPHPIPGSSS